MVFGDRNIEHEFQIAGKNIENTEKSEYLGSLLTSDNSCPEEMKSRIDRATGVIASLKHIWNSKKLQVKSKFKLLTTCVLSVLLYAPET